MPGAFLAGAFVVKDSCRGGFYRLGLLSTGAFVTGAFVVWGFCRWGFCDAFGFRTYIYVYTYIYIQIFLARFSLKNQG